MYIRFLRGPDAPALGMSLSDILPDESKAEWAEAQTPVTPAPTPEKTSDLGAALDKTQTDATQTPPKKDDEVPVPENKPEEPGKDPEETVEAPEGASDSPEDFYTAVNQITGEPVEVEYGEVDPLTPEGVAIRERAIRADEVQKFEQHIKTSDPRAYAYFMHRQQGGDDATFFEEQTVSLPDKATFKASVELQTQAYKQYLIQRGLDADVAEAQVAAAIKGNVLEQKALAVYDLTQQAQSNQLAEMERLAAEDKKAFEEACTTVLTTLHTQIDSGSLKFIVPEAKKPEFKAYVQSHLTHEDGKFYAIQEINGSAKEVLESLYFAYVKGDLNSLVEKRANTKAVQRLKLGVQKASGGIPSGVESTKKKGEYLSLGEL